MRAVPGSRTGGESLLFLCYPCRMEGYGSYFRAWLGGATALSLAGFAFAVAACTGAAQPESRAAGAAAPSQQAGDVVARVGDQAITLDDVDHKVLEMSMNPHELYQARQNAAQELVTESLLQQAAKARGVNVEDLVEGKITSRIEPVTEEDVDEFFEANRARMGGRTLDSVRPQIRAYLESQSETLARESFLSELRSDLDVSVTLEPPRAPITVAAGEATKGPEGAAVTIVEYSDFQ